MIQRASLRTFILTLLLSTTIFLMANAYAEEESLELSPGKIAPASLPIGSALIRPQTIERIIRSIVSDLLNANLNKSRLNFKTDPIVEVIKLPEPTGDLKEIFKILGIKNTLSVEIQPLQTTFTLPPAALKIDVKNRAPNTFDVTASWSISKVVSRTENLALKIPAGVFERPFSINSAPVEIGLKPGSTPITIEISLTATLTEGGTKIKLNQFQTNLSRQKSPEFYLNLGALTVEGKPFSLQIQSNGQSLNASENAIRDQFKQLEPGLLATIRARMLKILDDKIKEAAIKIQNEPPLRYETNTDKLLAEVSIPPTAKKLFGDINIDFLFSYVQAINSKDLFSAQVASHVCFDNQCLVSRVEPGPIANGDIDTMVAEDDAGVILYESTVQSILHSDAFQARIREYYQSAGPTAGVTIAPSGVKAYLDPSQNSLALILNLEIDIRKTIKSNTPFGERIQLELGDLWELWFGTGKIVKIPIEVNFKLKGITRDTDGILKLNIETVLPFQEYGTKGHASYTPPKTCPIEICPSNVAKLSSLVGPSFLGTVNKDIKDMKLIPPVIRVPVDRDVGIQGLSFLARNLVVTHSRGLLLTTKMLTPSGDKK